MNYFPYGDSRVAELDRVALVAEQEGWTVGDLAAKILLYVANWGISSKTQTFSIFVPLTVRLSGESL